MKLWKIELLKLKANYTLHGFVLVYLLMLPLSYAALGNFDLKSLLHSLFGGEDFGADAKYIFKFPNNWEVLPYLASWFNVILSIGLIHFVSTEYASGMYKKTFIDGLTRSELYAGKLLMIFTFSTFCVAWLLLLILGFGFAYFEASEVGYFFNIKPLLLYFFQTLCYFSFALMAITLVRRSTTAILLFIGLYFLECLVAIPLSKSLEVFLPFEAFSEIVPIPFLDQLTQLVQFDDPANIQGHERSNLHQATYVSACYLLIMQVVIYLVFKFRAL